MGALATALVALSATLLAYAVLSMAFAEERQVRNRLQRLSAYESEQALTAEPLLAPFVERVGWPLRGLFARALRALMPGSYLTAIERRLVLAGSPRGLDAQRFSLIQTAVAFALGLIVALGRLALGDGVLVSLATGVVIGVISILAMLAWLLHAASSRQDEMRRSLSDFLDMLLISVEAGLGFDAAVAKIVMRSSGPLGEEFGRLLQDGQAGLTRRESLRRLADRTDVPELNAFIMAMVQADVFGIGVSSILRAQSHELRVKRRQRAQELAQKAPAKMVFPLIMCVLPATLIVLMGPAVISIGRAFGAF